MNETFEKFPRKYRNAVLDIVRNIQLRIGRKAVYRKFEVDRTNMLIKFPVLEILKDFINPRFSVFEIYEKHNINSGTLQRIRTYWNIPTRLRLNIRAKPKSKRNTGKFKGIGLYTIDDNTCPFCKNEIDGNMQIHKATCSIWNYRLGNRKYIKTGCE